MPQLSAPLGHKLVVVLLLLMSMLGVFPLDVILPSFPALADYLSVSLKSIAFSVSVFAIGVAVSQAIIGPLSDTLGRKRLLLGGLVVSIIGALGCVFSTGYEGFMFFRVVQAFGCGSFVLSQALVQDIYPVKQQNALRILLLTVSGLLISLSPLLGSVLQRYLGWEGSFHVFIIVALVVLLMSWALLPEPPIPRVRGNPLMNLKALAADRVFLISSALSSLAFTCHFAFVVVSPLLLMGHLGLSEYQFAIVFVGYGVAYVVGGLVAGKLNGMMHPHAQMGCGLVLVGFAGLMLFIWQFSEGLSIANLMLPVTLSTIGVTIIRPAATTYALSKHADRAGAAASASNTLLFASGGVASTVIASFEKGLPIVLASLFICAGLVGGLLLFYLRKRERSACAINIVTKAREDATRC
ncbi:MFS transporter [Pseudomonas entomophila]|uniref:MFS transporter n=1 Tax=Pseudomonas entomophila TaxID=312306 RepID=UPI0023D82916|nr:MFS transporter [Pseudomonas entomophila]MDF0730933.1 MFS transporter [Pseudomonas entomophila]